MVNLDGEPLSFNRDKSGGSARARQIALLVATSLFFPASAARAQGGAGPQPSEPPPVTSQPSEPPALTAAPPATSSTSPPPATSSTSPPPASAPATSSTPISAPAPI